MCHIEFVENYVSLALHNNFLVNQLKNILNIEKLFYHLKILVSMMSIDFNII